MIAIPILCCVALLLAVISLFPAASAYPLLSVAIILLSVALFIAYPFK